MSWLEIPGRAVDAAFTITGESLDEVEEALTAAAPIIVAAELRRVAHRWTGDAQPPVGPATSNTQVRTRTTWFQAATELLDRANELDPGGSL